MPRFFVWSANGDGDCLAARLAEEGEDVVLRIDEDWSRANLAGIVPHTTERPRATDIIVFGTSKLGAEAAKFIEMGRAVVGGAVCCDRLEMDRWYFVQVCHRLGLDVPETYRFRSYETARAFVQERGDRWVFKPSGDQEAVCTFVSKDAEELLFQLDCLEKKVPADFLLQHFEEGVEVSCEGWFNGSDWIDGAWNATKETKKFMAGDIGPATGCSSSLVYAYDREPAWAGALHRPFTAMLRQGHYKGPFDLNLIVTPSRRYVLEPTGRFGYDAIQNFVELWEEPFGVVLAALAQSPLARVEVESASVAAAIRLAIPPYPASDKHHRAPADVPVIVDEADLPWLWKSGVQDVEGQLFSAPTDGVIGALTAVGPSVDRATQTLLARAERLRIPGLMYRNDVGHGHMAMWEQLANWRFPLPPAVARGLKKKPGIVASPFRHLAWVE